MTDVQVIHWRLLVLFLLFGPMLGCVINSPCANLNATVDIKPRADLALVFGNDAIKAAVDAVTDGVSRGLASISDLTESGKSAALKTAKENGKNPSANDIAELNRYLSRDIVPAIKQNPTCNFTVSSVGKPYVSIEKIALTEQAGKEVPSAWLKNFGQTETTCNVVFRYILDGKSDSGPIQMRLGPGQTRMISLEEVNLPLADIQSGKSTLLLQLDISYPREQGAHPTKSTETWQYQHSTRRFISVSEK